MPCEVLKFHLGARSFGLRGGRIGFSPQGGTGGEAQGNLGHHVGNEALKCSFKVGSLVAALRQEPSCVGRLIEGARLGRRVEGAQHNGKLAHEGGSDLLGGGLPDGLGQGSEDTREHIGRPCTSGGHKCHADGLVMS